MGPPGVPAKISWRAFRVVNSERSATAVPGARRSAQRLEMGGDFVLADLEPRAVAPGEGSRRGGCLYGFVKPLRGWCSAGPARVVGRACRRGASQR